MADSKPGHELPRMVPDREDIRTRKGASQFTATKAQAATGQTPASSARAPRKGGGALIWMTIVLMLAAVVGLGLMAYSQSQLLAAYEERLQLADDRIVSLEQAMNETDESVAMNETAINAQFRSIKSETEMQMSEIRKLWDVANKRNRTWIEENQQAVGQLQTQAQQQSERLGTLQTALTQQGEQVKALDGKVATQDQIMTERQAAVASLQESVTESRQQLTAIQQSLADLNPAQLEERMITLTLTQEMLQEELSRINGDQKGLSSTVSSMDEILKSIDTGRLETNKRLVALREQLQSLEARVSALTDSP